MNQAALPDVSVLRAMAASMAFRGPDDEGIHVAPSLAWCIGVCQSATSVLPATAP